ncbi:hypothetical protein Hesp01_24950 [Herbidospora sp. NBRC 101105]|nr:hypothetical protein Hesp01_24950 [Herbidospora sp. NBRC 101105]
MTRLPAIPPPSNARNGRARQAKASDPRDRIGTLTEPPPTYRIPRDWRAWCTAVTTISACSSGSHAGQRFAQLWSAEMPTKKGHPVNDMAPFYVCDLRLHWGSSARQVAWK